MRRFIAWVVATTPLVSACLSVINADEYRISDKGGSGASGSGGAGAHSGGASTGASSSSGGTVDSGSGGGTVDSGSGGTSDDAGDGSLGNPCGPDEVPVAGDCERVGVTDCTSGFRVDLDGACRAIMPVKDCTYTGLAFPQSTSCAAPSGCEPGADGYPPDGTLENIKYVHSNDHFPCSTGTKNCPFRSIGDALNALGTSGGNILLNEGTYSGDFAITASNVSIYGCGRATILGAAPALDPASPCRPIARPAGRGAAVCIPPDVTGVTLDGVKIAGAGYGVVVHGGDVTLRNLSIYNTTSYGLLVQEAKTKPDPGSVILRAKATLDHVSILRAGGVGIQVEGSDLDVRNSSVQSTNMLNSAPTEAKAAGEDSVGLSRGIALYPSMWSGSAQHADPEDFAQSKAIIESTAVTGSQEIAVFATGADVTIAKSFLGALLEESAAGRGVVAERSLATGAPTKVTVDHSVIEHVRDAAVDVRDATVNLMQTTIRDTRGRLGDGCSGQGVRIRSLPTVDAAPSNVTLDHVSVLKSRQSAVFAASSTVHLTSTLLRDVTPVLEEPTGVCKMAMGDGLTVESYAGLPSADVHLDRVRIDGAARAGLFAGNATISALSSVIECGSNSVVDATARHGGQTIQGALCGCSGTWAPCTFESTSLPSWASAGASPAWPDRSCVASICAFDTSQANRALAGASLWNYLTPETLPVQVPNSGCVDLTGLGVGRTSLVLGKPGFDTRATQGYFPQPLIAWSGTWGSAPLGTGYATSGWPIGAPLVEIAQAPARSLVTMGRFEVLTAENGLVLPDKILLGDYGTLSQGLIMLPEGGWYSVSIVPPDRFTCVTTGLAGGPSSTKIPVHVVPGLSASVFFDCTAADPETVIATVKYDILRDWNLAGESALGDLVADCMRSTIPTAAFAVMPLTAINPTKFLPAGDVTWAAASQLLPDGRVSETTLTGQQIVDLLNEQFGPSSSQFLAVSGLIYEWDSNKPVGSRVVLPVHDTQGNELVPTARYTLALPNYLNVVALQSAVLTLGPVHADSFGTCLRGLTQPVEAPAGGRVTRIP